MARELLTTLFCLAAIHSVCSLGETDVDLSPTPSVLYCKKRCPPGFSTFCSQNGTSRCVPCVAGTFSENLSRRRSCRPCSSCQDGEFELRPCTPTSNVRCKECSKCPPGFVVLKPCEGTRDTVCEKCSVAKGYVNYANIECDEGEIEDHLKNKEKDKPKGSMIIIGVEKPWPDGERKPKHQHTLTADENHPTSTVPLPGLPSVNPTPSTSYSPKTNGASSQRTHLFHSEVFASSSEEISSMSSIGVQSSIGPSLTPTMPAELESPPNVQRTKPTTKADIDTNTEEPSSYEMQRDDGNVPRHTTKRSIDQNSTRTAISLKPRGASSVTPSEHVNTLDLNARGIVDEHSTGFSPHYTLSGTEVEHINEMPVPGNRNRSSSKSSRGSLWGVIVVATGVGTVLIIIGVGIRCKQFRGNKGCFFKCPQPKCRRPRCPASSDCCDGNSVSSAAGVYTEQNPAPPVNYATSVPWPPASVTVEHESEDSPPNSNNPTLHTYLTSERTVVADIHHTTPSLFEVFNIRSYPKCITQVETTLNSSGGKLLAPDSDIKINVDSGAVPEGVNQRFFFRVVYDETSLLRDIPETPDKTLISPVIQCGPEDINLLKPVEIVLPHCLYLDDVKKDTISVYRCGSYSDDGPLKWEKVPKSWFTVKRDSIHIKTKTFSFWSIFACGGPKRKRATVFFNKPNPKLDTICFRFYIYSDNDDSRKRVKTKEDLLFRGSTQANEVPFKMFNDCKDITVELTDLEKGWEMHKTPSKQTYQYETAYRNGFRSHTSCEFTVKPQSAGQAVAEFSCNLKFQQDDHTQEYTINLNPGFIPKQDPRQFSVESSESETPSSSTCATGACAASAVREEDEGIDSQKEPCADSPAKVSESSSQLLSSLGCDHVQVTQEHCHCICTKAGKKWRKVLRHLGTEEVAIENLEENYNRVEEKCYQGLLAWSKSPLTKKATTKTLCDALRLAGCSKALETLSEEGVSCDACTPIPESNSDLGTCV